MVLEDNKGVLQLGYMIALILLVGIIVLAVTNIFDVITQEHISARNARLERTASDISELLIKSSGVPSDWENDPESLESLGLAKRSYVLSEKKVEVFSSLSLEEVRDSLGVEKGVYVRIGEEDDKVEKGVFPNDKEVAVVTRTVTFKGERTELVVMVW